MVIRASIRSRVTSLIILATGAVFLLAPRDRASIAAARQFDRIAFFRQDGLWIVRADGTGLRRVLQSQLPALYDPKRGPYSDEVPVTSAPAWSDGGNEICIGLNSAASLRLVDLAGRQLSSIPVLPYDQDTYRAYRRGGKRSYYIRFRNLLWPRRRYLFADYEEGDFRSNLMRWDGTETRRVGSQDWRVRESTVSSDGRRLAYGEDRGGLHHEIGGRQNVFLYNLVTNQQHNLYSTSLYPALELSLAPDGSRICFRRAAGDSGEERQLDRSVVGLWTVNQTGKLQRLTRDRPGLYPSHLDPQWSPDGRWIAYVQGENDPGKPEGLYLYELRAGRSRHLCQYPGFSHVWESNARHMIVSRGLDGLWRVSVPGGRARRIAPDGFYPAILPSRRG